MAHLYKVEEDLAYENALCKRLEANNTASSAVFKTVLESPSKHVLLNHAKHL